jgi:putative ABC transport system permease protein
MNPSIQSLSAALETLGANPLRTALSTLGVVIGVASLVAILALGDGLEAFSRAQIAQTTDLQTVRVTPRTETREGGIRVALTDVPRLDAAHAEELGERLAGRAAVAPFLTGSMWAGVPGDTARRAVLVTGTTAAAKTQLGEGLAAGRYLSDADVGAGSRVVVVPGEAAGWYGVDAASLPGRTLELGDEAYEIVGVRGGAGGTAHVHVPLSDGVRTLLEREDRRVALAVRAERVEDVPVLTEEIEAWLAARFGSADRFQLVSNHVRARQARQGMLAFKLIMGAIAGIALVVGGIGIMNILLASVFERTREIGIRKAAGARQRHILLQFLAEAVAITGLGSVVGVVLGLAGAFAITAVVRRISDAQVYAAFTWGSVLVAGAAAILVGLIFGTYPARRAARLSPIEAIRHE